MYSIRVRITVVTIIAILATILSIYVACYTTIKAENDQRSVEMMNLIGQETQNSLDKYFTSIEQSIEMAASISGDAMDSIVLVETGTAGSNAGQRTPEQAAEMDAYLSEYIKRVQKTYESVANHTYGVITYYYCISPEISENEHGFFYSKVGKTGFVEQPPLDARELDPDDIEHTAWYYTSIEKGRPSWIGPHKAHFLDEMWICSYIVPIYKAGTLIGVFGMDIPVDTLVAHVSSIKVYQTGYACLFDAEGRVIYHPEASVGEKMDLSSFLGNLNLLEDNNGDQLLRYSVNGQERQLSFSTFSNGYKLFVLAPVKEINSSWNRLVQIALAITLFMIAVCTVALLFSMRLITLPLQRLTAASQRLAAADYDVALDYEGKDEIGVLTGAFKQMRDQIKLYIEDLSERVYTDNLTGLPNMRGFFRMAVHEKQVILDRGGRPVIVYFNLVGMSLFNRQYGFAEGDRLLVEIGKTLSDYYGKDKVSRFSEDHFLVIADANNLEVGLREVFAACHKVNHGNQLPVRAGIYPLDLEEVTISEACDRAKIACEQYKGTFVSGYYYFDQKMLRQVENIRYVIGHLDQALSERWIHVYYQPIIQAETGKICDEEALSRWIDPERGMLSPADFIPVLENARLIYKLDLYVLDRMLEKMKFMEESGLAVVPQSVNLSRSDFEACDIVKEIRERVDRAGIRRDMITIEITESMIGSDFNFMKEQVARFRKLGFPVWMDDFGSGYSSLDVLQSIKFDLIKFDMSFMRKLDENDDGKIILIELMKMASALGVSTVCEGVETEEQVKFLRKIGCAKLQGYYYSKPVPLSFILEKYRDGTWIDYQMTRN